MGTTCDESLTISCSMPGGKALNLHEIQARFAEGDAARRGRYPKNSCDGGLRGESLGLTVRPVRQRFQPTLFGELVIAGLPWQPLQGREARAQIGLIRIKEPIDLGC